MSGRGAFRLRLATAADEPELRRLLRQNPTPGWVALSLEREPDYFLAAPVEGEQHRTIVGEERRSGRLVGLGSFCVRRAWLDGEPARLGYLGQLRIAPGYRGVAGLLRRGFELFGELHRDEAGPPLYVTTIIEGNLLGRAVLEQDRPYKPNYRRRGVLCTLALPLFRRREVPPLPRGLSLRPATAADLPEVARCLQRNLRRYQFAPIWQAEDLCGERTRGLRPEDFVLALDGERVRGCLALWDQRGFKQAVVRGYSPPLRLARPLYNAAARLRGHAPLAEVGQALPLATASHLALDHDDPALLWPLLATAHNRALSRGLAYLSLGLCEGHPLLSPIRAAYRHLEYRALLYLAHWPDGAGAAAALDDRTPHIEVGVI